LGHGDGAQGIACITGAMPSRPTLKQLRADEARCRRCDLYKNATQVVPGEGPARARIMLVGEEPGDKEDRAGKPFVGPAGRVLDQAIADAGIDRKQVFITNAVKHFKFEMRGKRRLHKKPNVHEIERCRWWIDLERAIVKPAVVVALGATAVRSLMGKNMTIGRIRGRVLMMPDGGRLVATIHPSYILRIEDEHDKQAQYRAFVHDLKVCAKAAAER
jgi:uracil-DNA glycosylase family protein